MNDVHISYDQLGEAAREHVAKCPHCLATDNQPMCPIGSLLAWGEIRAKARAAAVDAFMHLDQMAFPA